MRKTIITFIAALSLAIGTTNFVPANAQAAETATITPEFPDGTSCVGAQDAVTWQPQSVPDLTGYEVTVEGYNPAGGGTNSSSFAVGPDQISTPFTVPSAPYPFDAIYVYTVVSGEVSSAPFSSSGFDGEGAPQGISWQDVPGNYAGNGTATVTFNYSLGVSDGFVQPIVQETFTASPGGEIGTGNGLSSTFTGLTNGVAYTFTLAASNECGTSSFTSGRFVPEDVVITAPQQTAVPVNQPYSETFLATGGVEPYGWQVVGGTLPPGLSLGVLTGTLSGTPTTVGVWNFTLEVFDASNPGGPPLEPPPTLNFTLTVGQAPGFTAATPPLTVFAGQTYGYDFAASGFPAPRFSLGGGAPSWLSINPTTGAVSSGTAPTHPRSLTYAVTATNSIGSVTAGPFTITIEHGQGHHHGHGHHRGHGH